MSPSCTWDIVNRTSLVQVSSGNHDAQNCCVKSRRPHILSSGSYMLPAPLPQCPLTFTGEWYKCHWFSSVPALFSLLPNKSHTMSFVKHLLGIITKCKVTCFINSHLPIICTRFVSVAHAKQGHLLQPSRPPYDSALGSPSFRPQFLGLLCRVYFLPSHISC